MNLKAKSWRFSSPKQSETCGQTYIYIYIYIYRYIYGDTEVLSDAQVMGPWVRLLLRNLPDAFGLAAALRELHASLVLRQRQAQQAAGSSLCASEWPLGCHQRCGMA